jgi:hypothetical protein
LLPEEAVLDWFVQICLGLKHVHDRWACAATHTACRNQPCTHRAAGCRAACLLVYRCSATKSALMPLNLVTASSKPAGHGHHALQQVVPMCGNCLAVLLVHAAHPCQQFQLQQHCCAVCRTCV